MSTSKINLGISFAIATLTLMVAATIYGGINSADAQQLRINSPITQTATSAIGQANVQQQSNAVASTGDFSPNKVDSQTNDQSQYQFADSSAKVVNKCCEGTFIDSPLTQTATSAVGQSNSQLQFNSVTSSGAFSPNTVGSQSNSQSSSQVAYSDAKVILTSDD